jgi:hypothetical protein
MNDGFVSVQNLKIPNATNSLVDDSIGLDNVETNA